MEGTPVPDYARWRAEWLNLSLQETAPSPPGERVLQLVWLRQRLQREALRTFDGSPVAVLHPGFWNREPGPDFRGAVIQFGDERPVTTDVEVDLLPSAWHQHGHDRNPAFRNVGLHVVWTCRSRPVSGRATLAVADLLDAPLHELRDSFGGTGRETPPASPGACASGFRGLTPAAAAMLLLDAARTRLRLKAGRLTARARQAGWDQALWEGLFQALGYKHNPWPMRRLAELVPRLLADLSEGPARVFELQARLLGLAGLLPEPQPQSPPEVREWLGRAWEVWWRWRGDVLELQLPPALWHRAGIRPANQPARRLALAAHWLAAPGWTRRWQDWLVADLTPAVAAARFEALLEPGADSFWEHRWTPAGPSVARPQPLLGRARATDVAMNVVLPWLWGRAEAGGDDDSRRRLTARYRAWPMAQDNAVLRLARQRLLGVAALPRPLRAAHQQGVLQLVNDFCAGSNALCEGCQLPELLEPGPHPARRG